MKTYMAKADSVIYYHAKRKFILLFYKISVKLFCVAFYKFFINILIYFKIAFIRLIPADTFSCLDILKVPNSPVLSTWGPPQISFENSPTE